MTHAIESHAIESHAIESDAIESAQVTGGLVGLFRRPLGAERK